MIEFWNKSFDQSRFFLPACLDDWKHFEEVNKCYKFFDSSLSWNDARKSCQGLVPDHASDLASAPDNKTNIFLTTLPDKRSLLGGHINHAGSWSWSDGSAWSEELWQAGQPSGGEEYLEMINITTGDWNDVPLEHPEEHGYICQYNVKKTNKNKHLMEVILTKFH